MYCEGLLSQKLAKHIMAPVWLQGPLLTLALLFSGECYAQGRDTRSSSNRQSPIVIIPDKTTPNPKLGSVSLSGYGESKKLLAMMNTGKEEQAKYIMAPVWLQGPLLTLALLFSGECYAQVWVPGATITRSVGRKTTALFVTHRELF
ncbi:hypothetical protein lerEdw1_020934 [Lerista edwardsae]|nr:hypothetical protein lerEdw1_020934 [Lerista edwardsae]